MESEKNKDAAYCPAGFVDTDTNKGTWREIQPLQSVGRLSANRASGLLYSMRDKLKECFMMPSGKIPWQDNVLDEGRDCSFD